MKRFGIRGMREHQLAAIVLVFMFCLTTFAPIMSASSSNLNGDNSVSSSDANVTRPYVQPPYVEHIGGTAGKHHKPLAEQPQWSVQPNATSVMKRPVASIDAPVGGGSTGSKAYAVTVANGGLEAKPHVDLWDILHVIILPVTFTFEIAAELIPPALEWIADHIGTDSPTMRASSFSTYVFYGNTSAAASTDTNWAPVGVPAAGDDVVWDIRSGANPTTWDLAITLSSFSMNAGYTGVVTQAANFGTTGAFTFAQGKLTGSNAHVLTVGGNFIRTGGTVTDNVLQLTMTGTADLDCSATLNFLVLTITGIISMKTASQQTYSLINSQIFNIDTGLICTVREQSATYTNTGTINGPGILRFAIISNNVTRTFGTINAPVEIRGRGDAPGSYICTLGASAIFGTTLAVLSDSASYTATLAHGSNYQLTVTGAATLGVRGLMTQGTGTWTFGSYTQSGASSVFAQGGILNVGSFLMSLGSFAGGTTLKITDTGDFTWSGGSFAGGVFVVNLTMSGSGKTLNCFTDFHPYSITFSGNTALATKNVNTYKATVSPGITVTTASGAHLQICVGLAASGFSNSGTVNGASGGLDIYFSGGSADVSITFGTVSCPVWVTSILNANKILSLGAATTLGSTLLVSSSSAQSVALSHGSNYQLAVTGVVTLGALGTMSQGTGTWTFTGGLMINGVSALFTMGGDVVSGGVTITAGTLTGDVLNAHKLTCNGTFANNGGTLTGNSVYLRLGTGGSLAGSVTGTLAGLRIMVSATISLSYTVQGAVAGNGLVVDAGQTMTIAVGQTLTIRYWNTLVYSNLGAIAGTGTINYQLNNANMTITFGTVSCPVIVDLYSSAAYNRILMLAAITTFGSTLTVQSSHASFTATLDLSASNYALSAVGITVGVRGILNGRGSTITCSGTWNALLGSFTYGTSSVFLTAAGDIYMKAGQSFWNLTKSGAGNTLMQSDITVLNNMSALGGAFRGVDVYSANNKILYVYGDVIGSGFGTQRYTRLVVRGEGKHIVMTGSATFSELKFEANVTCGEFESYRIDIESWVTVTMVSFKAMKYWYTLFSYFTNDGLVQWSSYGSFQYLLFEYNPPAVPFVFGSMTGLTSISFMITQTGFGDKSITLGQDINQPNASLNIAGLGTEIITFNGNGHTVNGTFARIYRNAHVNQGAGAWVFSGNFWVYNANTIFTQGGPLTATDIKVITTATFIATSTITDLGIWDSSDGTFTPGTSTVIMSGVAKTIKLAAGQSFYNLNITGTIALLSAITIVHTLTVTGGTLDLSASNYALSALDIIIGASGDINGRASTITCSGNWDSSAGTFTYGTSSVVMTGTTKTLKTATSAMFYSLQVSGTISTTSSLNISYNVAVDLGKVFTIGAGKTVDFNCSGGGTYSNLGFIVGNGVMTYSFNTADATITFGTVNAPVVIRAYANAIGNRICTLGASTTFGGSLTIASAHPVWAIILDDGANQLLGVWGATTLGSEGIMVQGTGHWTFWGTFTENSATALFEAGHTINFLNGVTISAGTFNANNAYLLIGHNWDSSGSWFNGMNSVANMSMLGAVAHTAYDYPFNTLNILIGGSVQANPILHAKNLTIQTGATLTVLANGTTVFTFLDLNGTISSAGWFLNITASNTNVGYLNGTWDGNIALNGTALFYSIYTRCPMIGSLYTNRTMYLSVNSTSGSIRVTPTSAWTNITLRYINITFVAIGALVGEWWAGTNTTPAKVEWAPTLLPLAGYSARFDGILIAAMQTGLLGKFPFIYNGAWSTHLITIRQETVQLGGGGAAASSVVCEFTWTVNYAIVTFTDKSKGDIVEWHWSFGDGSYNESQDPRHRYMAIGSYTVTLTVIDSHGKVDTRIHMVNITQMMSTDTIFSHIPVWLLLPIIALALFALIGTDNRFMRFGCIVALLALVVCMLIGGKLG